MVKEPIKVETIIRTICFFIALANELLVHFGKQRLPFTEDETYQIVSHLVTYAIAIWCWWKNNSFTQPAIKADAYMEELRKSEKAETNG
jgi:SPP1 family holin